MRHVLFALALLTVLGAVTGSAAALCPEWNDPGCRAPAVWPPRGITCSAGPVTVSVGIDAVE